MADITYEAIKNEMAIKSIPILTLDERWYKLIPEKVKTDEIKFWEKELNDLLKRQGQVNSDIKEVKKIKSQLIQEVVDSMEDDDTDSKKKKKMDQSQRLIQEAKDKLSSLEDEALDIPREIVRANEKLMVETVKVCYERLNTNKEDLEVLDKWINATRVKLKKNILIKQEKEAASEKIYSYMHDILGSDMCGVLDRINEE
ncbi:MAG: hypothetical protein ACI4E1_01945 [Lachnospira sp.]